MVCLLRLLASSSFCLFVFLSCCLVVFLSFTRAWRACYWSASSGCLPLLQIRPSQAAQPPNDDHCDDEQTDEDELCDGPDAQNGDGDRENDDRLARVGYSNDDNGDDHDDGDDNDSDDYDGADDNGDDYDNDDDDDDDDDDDGNDDRLARVGHGLEEEELLHLAKLGGLLPGPLPLSHVHLHLCRKL